MSRIAAVFRGEELKLQQLKVQLEERKAQLEALQRAKAEAEAQERRQLAAMLDGVLDRQKELHRRRAAELEGLDPAFLVQPGEDRGPAAAAEAERAARARRSVVEAEADALLSLLGSRGFQVQGGEDAALEALETAGEDEPSPAAEAAAGVPDRGDHTAAGGTPGPRSRPVEGQ